MDTNLLKIVIINGSPHSSISNTQQLNEMLIKAIEKETNVTFTTHYLTKENIMICRGCTRCMRKGSCVIADKDDVHTIINDLLEADFIIFSSPVYVSNISSLLKIFFERCAYITHRIALEGKIGVSVVSSQSQETEHVTCYMNSVMESMGIHILGSIAGNAFFHGKFENLDKIREDIQAIVSNLLSYDPNDEGNFSDSEIKRRAKFQTLMKMESVSKILFKEDYKYWNDKEKSQ
ncbi:MAG: flavodoxin family protein [Lutisporaceae bacterium]